MFKLQVKENKYILKAHEISELWKFVVSNSSWNYQFYIDYTPITEDEFLKVFLQETQDYRSYLFLFKAIKNPRKTIQELCE